MYGIRAFFVRLILLALLLTLQACGSGGSKGGSTPSANDSSSSGNGSNTGGTNTGGTNTGGTNTGGTNTGGTNTGGTNTGGTDTGGTNTGGSDTGGTDTGGTDTGGTDTGGSNTGGTDTGGTDTGGSNTGGTDTGGTDTGGTDTGGSNTGGTDTGGSDTGGTNTGSTTEQAAIDVVDNNTYSGDIPLSQQVVGKPAASFQTTGNPFDDAYFYLSPDIETMMDASLNIVEASGDSEMVNKIKYVQRQPSAVWMDSIETIYGNPDAGRSSLVDHLDSALAQQQFYADQNGGQKAPMTVVIIIYDLPDRDCAAFASNGKLTQVGKPFESDTPLMGDGFERYRVEYIGEIAKIFSRPKYSDLRIVALLEPDSFPNMITNTNELGIEWANASLTTPNVHASLKSQGYCDRILNYSGAGTNVEGEGTAENPGLGLYGAALRVAIRSFADIPNVYTYLDIGHAGWLGWDSEQEMTSNMKRGVKYFKQLIDGADGKLDGKGLDMVRGFASNTSGYTPVDEPMLAGGLANRDALMKNGGLPFYQWNPAVDELTYATMLRDYFTSSGTAIGTARFDSNKLGFIIDTARNGWGAPGRPTPENSTKGTIVTDANRVDKRVHRGHWCNVNHAGIGESPKASPSALHSYVDAFFWMKPPGESDGISFDVKNYMPGTQAYDNLDAIDKAVVDQANEPAYAGKSLDTMCQPGKAREEVTVDVVPAMAPQAGAWFHKQFLMLIENAYPPLGESDFD